MVWRPRRVEDGGKKTLISLLCVSKIGRGVGAVVVK